MDGYGFSETFIGRFHIVFTDGSKLQNIKIVKIDSDLRFLIDSEGNVYNWHNISCLKKTQRVENE